MKYGPNAKVGGAQFGEWRADVRLVFHRERVYRTFKGRKAIDCLMAGAPINETVKETKPLS